jgi:hypothetical protein
LAPPVLVTLPLWITSGNPVTPVEVVVAFLLFLIPWHFYRQWKKGRNEELPFFAMFVFMYWLYYALQLFWGSTTVSIAFYRVGRDVDPGKIREALFMSLLGVLSVGLGMKSGLGRFFIPKRVPELVIKPTRWNYVRGVLIVSSLLSIFEPSTLIFGEGARQPISIFLTLVPMLAFALLFRRYIQRASTPLDKLLIVGFIVTRSVLALSSGWLGSLAGVVIICGAVYTAERRRLPRLALVLVAILILFFQVGKEEFRRTYWTGQAKAGQIERVSFWINSSIERWGAALNDPSGEGLKETLTFTLSRVSLLAQTGDVIEQTPAVVPYQNGRLYSYMLYTWIPRVVWPDKPSMNEANQFYQVAYGVTEEENLDKISIAIGILTESYINFGWLGVVGIMFLVGAFIDFYRCFFFSSSAGMVLNSLGIVLLPQMLAIESQMAQYFGGFVQQVVLSLLVLLPAMRFSRTGSASTHSSRIVPAQA